MNQTDKMIEYVDKALEIDSKSALCNKIKVNLLIYDEKYEEAFEYLPAIRSIPDNATDEDLYQKQSALNVLAMASYTIKDYERALKLANESIAVKVRNGWPYTTLAETYSYMGKDEEFYEALEKAFEMGIAPKSILKDEPYQRFLNKKRFKDLAEKYTAKKVSLDQVVTK